ncbi:MAG: lysylphosphatidylglycerol synthase transmembrane domain-containing protein [Bacillota bacterium]
MGNIKQKLLTAISFSLLIIIGITIFTVDQSTWQSVKDLRVSYLFLVMVVIMIDWLLNGLKLCILAAGVGVDLPFLTAVEIGLVEKFFTNITPSGVGGQPFKIVALKENQVSLAKASVIVIVELILQLLFFMLGFLFILIKLHKLFFSYFNLEVLILIIPLGVVGLGIVIYLLLYKPRYLAQFFFWLMNRSLIIKLVTSKKRHRWKRKFVKEVRVFNNTIWRYLKSSKGELFSGLSLTVLSWSAKFMVLYFVIRGLNLSVDFSSIYLLQLLIYIIAIFIPVPGASGIEVILAGLLDQFLPVALVGIVVASWRFFTYYLYIFFGGLVTFKVFKFKLDQIYRKEE